MFLDEALWRIKYKIYSDRIDFLVQLNAYHNFAPDEKSAEPIIEPSWKKPEDKNSGQKSGLFRSAEEYYEYEASQVPAFSLQTIKSAQAITSDLELEANNIIN
jgi:hypothetical protein